MKTANPPQPTIALEDNCKDIPSPNQPIDDLSLPSTWNLTKILRWCGGGVLLTAVMVFLWEGVYSFSPLMRHWIMLGLCCILGLMGMITGIIMKDTKGARTFLGFAACTFPALASQLGAMFFSIFGNVPAGMPQPLVFSMTNSSLVLGITALTLGIALPVSYLTFRVLARTQAGLLTGVFAGANLALLLPIREGIWISAILTVMAAILFIIDTLILRQDFRLENFEGRIARLMLTTPLLVMLGRSLFYPTNVVYYGYMLILSGAYLTFHLGRIINKDGIRTAFQIAGQLIMTLGWFTSLLPYLDMHYSINGLMVYLFLVPPALLLAAQVLVMQGTTSIYPKLSGFICLVSVLLAHLVDATPLVSVMGIGVALVPLILGALLANKATLTWGVLAVCVSFGNFGLQIFQNNTKFAWVALAIIGITTLFCASIMENKNNWIYEKGVALWGRYNNS